MGKFNEVNMSDEIGQKLSMLETSRKFYVDGSSGLDSNDGLTELTPFKTLKHLSKYLFGKKIPGVVNILIKPGTYTDSLHILLPESSVIINTYGGEGKAVLTGVNSKYINESSFSDLINYSILVEGTRTCTIGKNIEVAPITIPKEKRAILILAELSFVDIKCDINLLNTDVQIHEVTLINVAGGSGGVRTGYNTFSVNNYNGTKNYIINSMSGASLTLLDTVVVGDILRSVDSGGSYFDVHTRTKRTTEDTRHDSGFDINKVVNGIVYEVDGNANGKYMKYSSGIVDAFCEKRVLTIEPNTVENIEFIHPILLSEAFNVSHASYSSVEGVQVMGAAGDTFKTVIRVENKTGIPSMVHVHVRIIGRQ